MSLMHLTSGLQEVDDAKELGRLIRDGKTTTALLDDFITRITSDQRLFEVACQGIEELRIYRQHDHVPPTLHPEMYRLLYETRHLRPIHWHESVAVNWQERQMSPREGLNVSGNRLDIPDPTFVADITRNFWQDTEALRTSHKDYDSTKSNDPSSGRPRLVSRSLSNSPPSTRTQTTTTTFKNLSSNRFRPTQRQLLTSLTHQDSPSELWYSQTRDFVSNLILSTRRRGPQLPSITSNPSLFFRAWNTKYKELLVAIYARDDVMVEDEAERKSVEKIWEMIKLLENDDASAFLKDLLPFPLSVASDEPVNMIRRTGTSEARASNHYRGVSNGRIRTQWASAREEYLDRPLPPAPNSQSSGDEGLL